jgi:hypothetical protein
VKQLLCSCLLLLFPTLPQAQTDNDDLQLSLLTVMPRAKAVYTIYGHSALRIYSPSRTIDAVLNWGTFDSSRPHFIYRFLMGQTDYFLSATATPHFISAYKAGNSTVVEQVINIPDSMKTSLLQMLQTCLLPENVDYRYNMFFDNCTTRPRDIIEQFCGGTLVYPQQTCPVTIRTSIHRCTEHYPWMQFGIDLLTGSGADSLISRRTEMFLPERLMNLLSRSPVETPDGKTYPVILSEKTILQATGDGNAKTLSPLLQPVAVSVFILLIYIALALNVRRGGRGGRIPFAVLFAVAGLGGCIIAGLVFLSEHPCTAPNWNILWLHPLHLIPAAGFLFKGWRPLCRWYHAANLTVLTCFLLGWWRWIPQELNVAAIPIVAALCTASICELTSRNS